MTNKVTKQQIQDAMWDRLTAFGTVSARDAYLTLRHIKEGINPEGNELYQSYLIRVAFERWSPLPAGTADDVCDAFADLEAELYEAKEAELMKGY